MGQKIKLFLFCNKVDQHRALFIDRENINEKQFFLDIKNQYPGIFNRFKNKNPLSSIYSKYNFDFVLFSAGDFNPTQDGSETFTEGLPKYPRDLWKAILKVVKGFW